MATNSDIIRQHIFCQVIYFKTYCLNIFFSHFTKASTIACLSNSFTSILIGTILLFFDIPIVESRCAKTFFVMMTLLSNSDKKINPEHLEEQA